MGRGSALGRLTKFRSLRKLTKHKTQKSLNSFGPQGALMELL